jgi:hypothetical protein
MVRKLAAAVSALVLLAGLVLNWPRSTAATADPSHVSFALEGCRNTGSITLPNGSGQFVCPDADYVQGNLGSGWNELDLVPLRLVAKAGSSAPASQTYAIAVAADAGNPTPPGVDVLSTLTLNTALSSASCSGATTDAQQNSGTGFIYRLVTITQQVNTTCVYDYYGRLALGSSANPGSSLHMNLLNQNLTTSGIGSKENSLPVNKIVPQSLSKVMSASQEQDYTWNITKSPSAASVDFGDVCADDPTLSKPVSITVNWTRLAAVGGKTSAIANISATNPDARSIEVCVSDTLYQGTTQTTQLYTTSSPTCVTVPANTTEVVLTDTPTGSFGNAGDYLNDVVTATYNDPVTGVPIPGDTTATAQAQIQAGTGSNASADITDTESITGTGLQFSLDSISPSINGSSITAPASYVLGTPITGPLDWDSGFQSISGSVTFNKTIDLAALTVTSGALTDTANLTGSSGFTASSGPKTITIGSSANVTLTISKTMPDLLNAGDKLDVTFSVAGTIDPTPQTQTITFNGSCGSGTTCTQGIDVTGLVPDKYTVTETGNCYYPSGSQTCNPIPGFGDAVSNQRTVDLSVGVNGVVTCLGTASFNNVILSDITPAVAKVTYPTLASNDPDYNWNFSLWGPNVTPGTGSALATTMAQANQLAATFGLDLTVSGTYIVTETPRTNWVLTGVTNPDGSAGTTSNNTDGSVGECTFTVNILTDTGSPTCTFTNTKQGQVTVNKTELNEPLSGNASFVFELLQGASTSSVGTVLETETLNAGNNGQVTFSTSLTPGQTYQMCENVLPGWNTNLPGPLFTPGSGTPPNLPDNSNVLVCSNFSVTPGQNYTFNVNNTPPPGGLALTIGFWKNWASCSKSKGHQQPVLDQTLFAAGTGGIVISDPYGMFSGYTLVDTSTNPNFASDCNAAVALLNKSTKGNCPSPNKKEASNPAYNLGSQLLGAELNNIAGAGMCSAEMSAIGQAQMLLGKYKFNGCNVPSFSKADATTANSLAYTLDLYNNNMLPGCP